MKENTQVKLFNGFNNLVPCNWDRDLKQKNFWVWGPTRTGKSRFYLEVLIETRGMITIIDEDLVIIQEVSKMLDHVRSILMKFHVILRKPEKVEEKMHVKV